MSRSNEDLPSLRDEVVIHNHGGEPGEESDPVPADFDDEEWEPEDTEDD